MASHRGEWPRGHLFGEGRFSGKVLLTKHGAPGGIGIGRHSWGRLQGHQGSKYGTFFDFDKMNAPILPVLSLSLQTAWRPIAGRALAVSNSHRRDAGDFGGQPTTPG